jgi:tetratricopeptide (TPR) repeat protein
VKNPVKTPTPKPLPTPKAPDVQSIIQEGIAYRETGKLNKAIASFKEALKYEPNNAEAALYLQETQDELDVLITDHLNKGIKYFNEDALEDAIREWNKVLELDPSHQEAAEYKEKAQKRLDALKD